MTRTPAVTPDQFTTFGELLKFLRRRAGLTQRELSIAVGYGETQISRLEQNQRPPDAASLRARFVPALQIETERDWVARLLELAETSRSAADPVEPDAPAETPAGLPTGTVTFLFTDIQGSTRLWQQHPDAMPAALARHHAILKNAIAAQRGHVFQIVGDAFCAAFATPAEAVGAALAAQRGLRDEAWGQTGPVRVRMALHSGSAPVQAGDTVSGEYRSGITLSRAARLLSAAHGEQILLSQAAYDLLLDQLPAGLALRDLGEHQLKDLVRPEHIYQAIAPDLPADFPPLKSLRSGRHNLPLQLTSFVGREHDLAAVKRLLATTRLLTLTGVGGTGKTRLALQVAAELLDQNAEGVWLVELAALADPAFVPRTVAATFGLRDQAGRSPLETLLDHLRPKAILLVLDNCEHLIEASAQLVDAVLRACPRAQVLATSREGLGIAGEVTWSVPSLSLPDARQAQDKETVSASEAVRLFVQRAQAAKPDFALSDQNAGAVARICQRLDGIPLAIELAAARVKVLTVEQIATRLAERDRFRLLTGGSRTALERQQTLRAAMDWSYQLLSAPERRLLRRLAVFAGGWTLEAAEQVCSGDGLERLDVLDWLARLVNKSLVVISADEAEVSRYHFLETIREYALERWRESDDVSALRQCHTLYYLGLAETAAFELDGPRQRDWNSRLRLERGNLRAALDWIIEQDAGDLGPRLVRALEGFWFVEGLHGEGRQWITLLLARARTAWPAEQRAQALRIAGVLSWQQGDYAAARGLLEECATTFRQLDDQRGLTQALNGLGRALLFTGEHAHARALLDEAIELSQEIGDRDWLARSLEGRAYVAMHEADYPAARALFERALSIQQSLDSPRGFPQALNDLGDVARCEGDYERAADLYRESLARFQANGIMVEIGSVLHNLGYVMLAQGDQPRARALFADSLALHREHDNQPGMLESLAGFGALLAAQGQPRQAAVLFGAITALRAAIQAPMWPAERVEFERNLAGVRAALGEAAVQSAFRESHSLTLSEATAYALRAVSGSEASAG